MLFFLCCFSFLFLHVPASFLCFIILACFHRYFICSLLNFPSWFWFFPCFLRGSQFSHKLILPLHRLVNLIQLHYSLIYKVVLDLFYSFLFKLFSILCFSVNFLDLPFVLVLMFALGPGFCVVCVAFLFSDVGGSFRFGYFRLLILRVSGTVLLSCSSFIIWCISSISRSENQPFFVIVLTWSASLWLV